MSFSLKFLFPFQPPYKRDICDLCFLSLVHTSLQDHSAEIWGTMNLYLGGHGLRDKINLSLWYAWYIYIHWHPYLTLPPKHSYQSTTSCKKHPHSCYTCRWYSCKPWFTKDSVRQIRLWRDRVAYRIFFPDKRIKENGYQISEAECFEGREATYFSQLCTILKILQ